MKNKKERVWPVKAYKNNSFLSSPSARGIRILSEMIEPGVRCGKYGIDGTVVFFGSARTISRKAASSELKKVESEIKRTAKPSRTLLNRCDKAKCDLEMSVYYEEARDLAEKLSASFKKKKKTGENLIISTGGGPGIMEAANLGAKKSGSQSIGLNISLPMEQDPNPYQTKDLGFEFHYFFVRKFWFVSIAKAIIVFPGGFGTMDELFEILTLKQTGKTNADIPIILYGEEYWNGIINFDNLVKWGMVSKKELKLFKVLSTVDEAYDHIQEKIIKQ